LFQQSILLGETTTEPEREADHSSQSSAEIKNLWR